MIVKALLLWTALALASAASVRYADLTVPPAGSSRRVDAIRQRGSLRVAVLGEYPWLKQTDDDGERFGGPAWLLAEEYARRLGVRLETVPVTFDDKLPIVQRGAVGIVIAPLLITAERAKVADFVQYSSSAQCLVGLASNPKIATAVSVDDLDKPDIKLTYIDGSMQGAWLMKRMPAAQHRGVPGSAADIPTDEIFAQRADATAIDKYFFAGLAKQHPSLATVPKGNACLASHELETPVGLAIDKDQPVFLAWLREVAEAMRQQLSAEQARVLEAGG